MAKHLIDLSVDARYPGNEDDINVLTNGQAATADVFNAPPQDLRQRMETLRQEVEDLKYVADADRAMVLAIEGTLTATLTDGAFSLAMSGSSPHLLIRPFISTAGAEGYGVLAVSGTQLIRLDVGEEDVAPKAWGQYDGAWGPAKRGANAIVVTFRLRAETGITIATDGEDYKLLVGVPAGTTVQTLVDALNTNSLLDDLYLGASVLGGLGATTITLPQGTDLAVLIGGAADAEAHKITEAVLEDFFANSANHLADGDTLAIWYDKLVDEADGAGGRRQQLVGSALSSEMLFNTRLSPEKIPGCIPVATVVGTKLFLIDGTVMTDGESIGGSGSEYLPTAGGTISGSLIVQGSTTLGDGTTDATRVNGTFAVGEAGASADTVGSEPFRVTKDGAVTAASVSTGAVTATSVNAGSGTIQTTGAVQGATVTASTSVTTPKVSSAAGPLDVGTLGQTTSVLGSLDVASSLSVGGSDQFQVSSAGAVTATSVDAGNGTIQTTGGVTATTVTLGVQSGTDGTLTVHNDAVGGTAIEVKNGAASKFKVNSSGEITAAAIANGTETLSIGTAGEVTEVQGDLVVAGSTTLGTGQATDDVIVRGSGDAFAVGGSSSNIDDAPFRVTSGGLVRATEIGVLNKIGVGAATYGASPIKITDASITTPAVTAGAATLNVSEAGQTTAILGNLDVAGTLKAGTSDAFQVAADGGVIVGIDGSNVGVTVHNGNGSAAFTVKKSSITTASLSGDGALVLGDTDAVPAGSITLYNGTTDAAVISVRNELSTEFFKVDGDGDVTIGASGEDGTLTIINDSGNTTAALQVKGSNGTNLFKVESTGATTVAGPLSATSLAINGTALVAPTTNAYREQFFVSTTSTIAVSGTSPYGSTSFTASGLLAGVYRVTICATYLTANNEDHDFALISAATRTTYPAYQPSQYQGTGTESYVSISPGSSQQRLLVIDRVLTLAANGGVVLVGYKGTAGAITLTSVHGSIIWQRIA